MNSEPQSGPPVLRVTIATGFFLPVPAAGGGATEKIWHGLAGIFASAGHSVTFVSRTWPGQASRETVDGVHHIRVPGFDHTRFLPVNLLLDARGLQAAGCQGLCQRGDRGKPQTCFGAAIKEGKESVYEWELPLPSDPRDLIEVVVGTDSPTAAFGNVIVERGLRCSAAHSGDLRRGPRHRSLRRPGDQGLDLSGRRRPGCRSASPEADGRASTNAAKPACWSTTKLRPPRGKRRLGNFATS